VNPLNSKQSRKNTRGDTPISPIALSPKSRLVQRAQLPVGKAGIILLGLALLFGTQYIFSLTYWFHFDLTPFAFLNSLACIWPDFCKLYRFPPYGLVAILMATVAFILFGAMFVRLKVQRIFTDPGFINIQPIMGKWLKQWIDCSLIAMFGLCQVYVIIQAIKDQPVLPLIWLLGLLNLLAFFWHLDQNEARAAPWKLLSPAVLNGIYLGAIALLLLTVAALHSQRWLEVAGFGIASILLWLRLLLSSWKGWDLSRRLERLIVPLITLGSFLLLSFGLNNWAWSFIGDEYDFYDLARQFANGNMTYPLLSGAGVYGVHPVLSSVWQGITMWLFGTDSYGWRVSNSLLLAISIPFFYYFARSFLGRTFAMFAVVLYGSAHVMLSFGHIGPNNVQVIIVMATSLAAFVWASRHGSWAGYVLVGICLGLGFYTFAVARIYCVVIAIWLAVYYFPVSFRSRNIIWSNFSIWSVVFGTALLTALPVLSTRSVWIEMANQTVFASGVTHAPFEIFFKIGQNSFYGFMSHLFYNENSFWIFGALADPITSSLMVVGLSALVFSGWQTLRVRVSLLASYILFVIIIAGTQQYDYPSITRIFAFVPFFAFFAAIGLRSLVQLIMPNQNGSRIGRIPNAFCIGSVVLLSTLTVPVNVWQSFVLAQQNSEQQTQAFILQTAQMSESKTGVEPHLFYVDFPQNEYWPTEMYSAYDIPLDRLTFVLPRDALLPDNEICTSSSQPAIIMIATDIPDADYIASRLQQCWPNSELRLIKDVRNSAGLYRLVSQSAMPFMHSAGGYWIEEIPPQTPVTQTSDYSSAWQVYQPTGLSQSSTGQLATVETATNKVVLLNSDGRFQKFWITGLIDPSDIGFLPNDGLVVTDASQGILWFDPVGHFLFKSDGGASPRGLFVAADGSVYIAATGSGSIIHVNLKGDILQTIQGPQFEQPTSVAVSPDGRIAVGDPVAGKVTINSSTGKLLTQYSIGLGDTGTDKPGLLWLKDGSFIYTDPVLNHITWIDSNGKMVKEWFNLPDPTSLILQSTGKMLVLESSNDLIVSLELR
jgi:Dolichyl-phosphate-mannose-protein mannosyltransferase